MTDTWGMPGAANFMAEPTEAQRSAAAELARRSPLVGSPEDLAAERARQLRTLTNRHTSMLANATDPVLHALLEAHGPQGSDLWPDCQECPERDGFAGSSDPESWPCPVWSFISDRMETP